MPSRLFTNKSFTPDVMSTDTFVRRTFSTPSGAKELSQIWGISPTNAYKIIEKLKHDHLIKEVPNNKKRKMYIKVGVRNVRS